MTKISNQYSLTNILTADLANSRLGINNVSPTVALDVTGAGKFSGALTLGGNTLLSYSSNTTTANAFPRLGISNTNATQQDFNISELYVSAGNGAVSGGLVASYSSSFPTSTPSIMLRNSGNGPLYFSTNGTIRQTIASTGAATFSGSITAGDIFSTDGTRTNFFGVGTGANVGYLGTTTNHALAFLTNNTEKMRIFANGNVAIGTTTDNGNKLNVVGNISSNSTVSGSIGSFSAMNANAFKSFAGSTSIAAGATATIYTMDTMGLYTVQASYVGASIIFCASAIFYAQIYSGNYVKCLDLYDGANIALFNSGSSIQVRNDGFGTYGFSWTILFQPAF